MIKNSHRFLTLTLKFFIYYIHTYMDDRVKRAILFVLIFVIFLIFYPIMCFVTVYSVVLVEAENGSKGRIIGSMTTSPKRIVSEDFKLVIDSILEKQKVPVDFLVLNVPNVFKRTNEPAIIPGHIINNPRIKVNIVEDIGPLTKIYPTMDLVTDDDVVISFDDDILYNKYTVKNLIREHNKNPDNVVTFSTMVITNYKNSPGFIEGYAGVLYKKKHFENFDLDVINISNECFTADDMIITNHLFKAGAHVSFIPSIYHGAKPLESGLQGDALHKNMVGGHGKRYSTCASKLLENGKYYIKDSKGNYIIDFTTIW